MFHSKLNFCCFFSLCHTFVRTLPRLNERLLAAAVEISRPEAFPYKSELHAFHAGRVRSRSTQEQRAIDACLYSAVACLYSAVSCLYSAVAMHLQYGSTPLQCGSTPLQCGRGGLLLGPTFSYRRGSEPINTQLRNTPVLIQCNTIRVVLRTLLFVMLCMPSKMPSKARIVAGRGR